MKLISFFLLCLVSSFPSTEVDKEKMPWSDSRTLTWSDFQGIPNAGDDYVASTNSGVSFSYSISFKNGVKDFNFTVESHFYPKLSWYRKGQVNDYILGHEQTHFDISELHARILKKRLSEATFSDAIKAEIKVIYEKTEQERRDMQNRFDVETVHSNNRKNEIQWELFVAEQLRSYERWK